MVAAILAAQQSAEKVNAIELKSKVALANTSITKTKMLLKMIHSFKLEVILRIQLNQLIPKNQNHQRKL